MSILRLQAWTSRKTDPGATVHRASSSQFIPVFLIPTITLAGVFLLSMAGCGEDSITAEDDPLDLRNLSPGTFRAEITGAAETTLEGIATFNSSDDEPGLVLTLAVLGPDGIVLFRNQGGRPTAGEYEVTSFSDVVFFGQPGFGGSLLLMQHGGFYTTQSGTITITNSSVNNLAGEFEFKAVDDEDEYSDGQEVTVIGSFRARCDETCL